MNYISVTEAEGVIGLCVAQEFQRAGNPTRPAMGSTFRFFEVRHAESLPGLETLTLMSALQKVHGIPDFSVATELLVDVTTKGEVLLRDLRRAGHNPVPFIITSGVTSTIGTEGIMRIARRELVAALGSLVQSARVTIAASLPTAEALRTQVEALRAKPAVDTVETPRADETLGLALGLIAWRINSLGELAPVPPMGRPREPKPFDPARFGLE